MAQGKCVMNEYDHKVNEHADSSVILSAEPFESKDEFYSELKKVRHDVECINDTIKFTDEVVAGINLLIQGECSDEERELNFIEDDIIKLGFHCKGTGSGFYARKAQIGIERILTRYSRKKNRINGERKGHGRKR